jgi:uncharacterized protein (DUF1501 family)
MATQKYMATRRQFLQTTIASSALLSLSGIAPMFLRRAAAMSASDDGRVLVVIQLSGGNDGLNTVIPYKDDEYRKRRPKLAIAESDVLKINDDFGFHPAMRGAADLLENAQLGIVQGVGYPQPNRSHFESMDIWHTCAFKHERRREGWLGRYLEQNPSDSRDVSAMHLGEEQQPLALAARDARVPSVPSLDRFRLQDIENPEVQQRIKALAEAERAASNDLLGFVQSNAVAAFAASERLEKVEQQPSESGVYPVSALAKKLQTVAQLIAAGLQTRVYYVTLDGFDTHSQQAAAHRALLEQWSGALNAFYKDLAARSLADRVLTFSFSEFGRRVQENASEGTDHGAAAPVFLAGTKVKPGLIGAFPSLTDLDDGDQKFHTDFRQVYAGILEQWLGCPSEQVLGTKYEPVSLLS